MKKSVVLAAALLIVAAGGAFAKDMLAILPFTGGQGEEGETIAELFSFERELTAVFTPVPRTSINAAIRGEQGFQLADGMTDPDTIAAIGKQVGAKYVVAGSITAVGKQNLLIIAILQIEGLRQTAGDAQTYGSIGEIRGKLPGMARNIAAASGKDASKLPRLAVPPMRMAGGADSREAGTLAQILSMHLVRSGKYAVYPRTKSLEQVQAEYGNQFSGDVADECLPSIGMGDNPRLALSVTARKLGGDTMFNAAIINLETGVQEAGETADYTGIEDGVRAMEELALRLTGQGNIYIAADAASFARAIARINNDSGGGSYTLTLAGSFTSDSVTCTANAAKTVTLKGEGGTRVITNSGNSPLFTVPAGITLVLDTTWFWTATKRGGGWCL